MLLRLAYIRRSEMHMLNIALDKYSLLIWKRRGIGSNPRRKKKEQGHAGHTSYRSQGTRSQPKKRRHLALEQKSSENLGYVPRY